MLNRTASQLAAIGASYRDKEKLIKPAVPKMKLPKMAVAKPSIGKPKLASTAAPPAFGRRRFYGEKWD